jgi:hypothetical protein
MLVVAFLIVYLWPAEPTVLVVPSGAHVELLAVGHLEVLNERPVLRLRYQTDIPLTDTLRLRRQVRELWPWFKPQVERGGYVYAAFLAQAPPTGFCYRHHGICKYRQVGYLLSRRSDGLWYFAGDSHALP